MAASVAPPLEAGSWPLLSIRGLAARFGPLRALDRVDLALRPGELVGLAGARRPGGGAAARGRGGLAGPGALRQPGHRREHHARARTPLVPALRHAAAGRGGRHPARIGDPVGRPLARRPYPLPRAAPATGGGAGDELAAAAAHPGRTHGVPGSRRGRPGGRAHHQPAAAGDHHLAGLPRCRADVPPGRPHRGAPPRTGGRRRPHRFRPPRRGHRPDIGPAAGLVRPPPADPPARPGRPAGLGRPLVQPVADPVRARRRPRYRTAVHPPAGAPGHLGMRRLPWPPAAAAGRLVAAGLRASAAWAPFRRLAREAKISSSWAVPVLGPSGLIGVITVFRPATGRPQRDELDLVSVYAGYAASAVERDRLLDQVTARNRVLETIREMLETLAGPIPVSEGLEVALRALRRGLQADEVALLSQQSGGTPRSRAHAGGRRAGRPSPPVAGTAAQALAVAQHDGRARSTDGDRRLAVTFPAPGGPAVLVASWAGRPATAV